MKKLSCLVISIIMFIVILSGCQKNEEFNITEYMVYRPNTVYKYKGTGHESAAQTIYNDYIYEEEGLYQRRIIASGQVISECFSIKNGEMLLYYNEPYANYFKDMTKAEPNNETLILKEPLKKGTKWERGQIEIKTEGNNLKNVQILAEITDQKAKVVVPYGEFDAIEVTIRVGNTEEVIKEYYAKDIGLIKILNHSRIELTDGEGNFVGEEFLDITSELESIEENTSYKNTEYFFYPDLDSDSVLYEEREVEYSTNQDIIELFQKELGNYSSGMYKSIIGDETKINDIEFNFAEGKVKIDFSVELERALKADRKSEALFIQSIVNTTGYHFNVPKVCITVDGRGYDGNLVMEIDEYIDVKAEIDLNN